MFTVKIEHNKMADQGFIYLEITHHLRAVADRIEQGELDIYNEPVMSIYDADGAHEIGIAEFTD